MTKSNSSAQAIPAIQKLRELAKFFIWRLRAPKNDFQWIFDNLDEYNTYLEKYSNKNIRDARIFEIGYGARPNRLIAFNSMGLDVKGIDLDHPLIAGEFHEFIQIYEKNGMERFIKSLVRHALFDSRERKDLDNTLKSRGYNLAIDSSIFLVDDASKLDKYVKRGTLDLIYSEDVFEHIPPKVLKSVIEKMYIALKPDGIALIRPCIFTGITGGHLHEWYPHEFENNEKVRQSEPWEHLRKKRYSANTYLNELSRQNYRNLFSTSFTILEEVVLAPELGKRYFTDDIKEDLQYYPEEELFSNNVLFVLKP